MKIVLDFDGTLTDISKRHYKVFESVVQQLGGAPIKKDKYWAMKRENLPWSEILVESKLLTKDEKFFLRDFTDLIEQPQMLEIDELLPGAKDTLESLSTDYELILVSLRRQHNNLINQLNKLGVTKYFTRILSGHSDTTEGVLKKKASVLQDQGIANIACVVGDTEADVSTAAQLGVPSIAITTGIRSEKFLSSLGATYVTNNLQDAKNIIETSVIVKT